MDLTNTDIRGGTPGLHRGIAPGGGDATPLRLYSSTEIGGDQRLPGSRKDRSVSSDRVEEKTRTLSCGQCPGEDPWGPELDPGGTSMHNTEHTSVVGRVVGEGGRNLRLESIRKGGSTKRGRDSGVRPTRPDGLGVEREGSTTHTERGMAGDRRQKEGGGRDGVDR